MECGWLHENAPNLSHVHLLMSILLVGWLVDGAARASGAARQTSDYIVTEHCLIPKFLA